MNGFSKLIELQNNIKKQGYKEGEKVSKKDYANALNKTFKNLNVKESDIHKSF